MRVRLLYEFILKSVDLSDDFSQGNPSDLFIHHFRTSQGVDIQFGSRFPRRIKVSDSFSSYRESFGCTGENDDKNYLFFPNDFAFRVEFNPNKCNLSSVSDLLIRFSDSVSVHGIRIARLDIAIDFPASVNPCLVLCSGMRKSFTASGSNGVESVYFGTRQSKNFIRLYNKRQEIFDTEHVDIGYDLWRLELESHSSFMLGSPPDFSSVFNRVNFFDGGLSSGDWKFDLIRSLSLVHGLQNVLRSLPPRTAVRYRKLFKQFDFQSIESPVDVYHREFPVAMSLLNTQLLTACGIKMWGD